MEKQISVDIKYLNDEELIIKPIGSAKRDKPNINENFPIHPTLIFCASGTGAGKTTLLQYLLAVPYNCFFNKIFFFCPTLDGAWKKFKINEERVYTQYTDAAFQKVLDEIKEDEDSDCLIIIDDCTGTNLFKRNNLISQFVFNHRHFPSLNTGTSLFFVGHNWHTLPKQIRAVVKDVILFKIHSVEELKEIADDLRGLMSMKDFMKIYHACTKDKYNFMYIKREAEDSTEMFRKNFNTILKIEYIDE